MPVNVEKVQEAIKSYEPERMRQAQQQREQSLGQLKPDPDEVAAHRWYEEAAHLARRKQEQQTPHAPSEPTTNQ